MPVMNPLTLPPHAKVENLEFQILKMMLAHCKVVVTPPLAHYRITWDPPPVGSDTFNSPIHMPKYIILYNHFRSWKMMNNARTMTICWIIQVRLMFSSAPPPPPPLPIYKQYTNFSTFPHVSEEAYYNYYRYYRRQVSPQVDVRIVIAVTITIVSVLQVQEKNLGRATRLI